MVNELNVKTFDEQVTGRCVIDFYTTGCPMCEKLSPVFNQVAEEIDSVKFFKVNLDDNMELAEKLAISHVPVVMMFDSAAVVKQHVGFMEQEKLVEFISAPAQQ